MNESNIKKLTIDPYDQQSRSDLFFRMCELLCLDAEREAKILDLVFDPSGVEINIGRLFAFLYEKKLKGKFDFEGSSLVVFCPEVQAVGKKAIEVPKSIKNTSVDDIDIPENILEPSSSPVDDDKEGKEIVFTSPVSETSGFTPVGTAEVDDEFELFE